MPGYNESWALSDAGIFFLQEVGHRPTISFYSFATRKQEVVTRFDGMLPPLGQACFSVSPDGEQLLVVRGNPSAANVQMVRIPTSSNERNVQLAR
jgi:hypothetical protein